jgi:hypothetical protein
MQSGCNRAAQRNSANTSALSANPKHAIAAELLSRETRGLIAPKSTPEQNCEQRSVSGCDGRVALSEIEQAGSFSSGNEPTTTRLATMLDASDFSDSLEFLAAE